MPKSLDKLKGAQKRRKASNSTLNSDAGPAPKQKKKCSSPDDGIAMSKQLASKVQKSRRQTRSTRATTKNNAPRVCGNGRPMPSLADLEKMYEDSDYDSDTDQKPDNAAGVSAYPARCKTPDAPILPEKLVSPNTLKEIASKVINILETGTISLLDDDGPPPPVIPQRKPKKPDVPYIVGCKDRPQVPERPPKIRFGVGDTKYGIDCNCGSSEDEDCENCPKKRRRRKGGDKISKSLFNAKSDEIAAILRENERREPILARGSKSPDSCDTVSYEYTDNSARIAPKRFSPLPSTSKDCATILENDKLFNNSLIGDSLLRDSQNDLEIIEVPLETVVVDDMPALPIQTPKPQTQSDNEDDCCVVIEPANKAHDLSLIDLDEPQYDFYNTINLLEQSETPDNDLCEVIDVDDIIAENQALMKKYKKEKTQDVVTFVDPNAIIPKPMQLSFVPMTENEVLISSGTSTGPIKDRPQCNPIVMQSIPADNVPSTQHASIRTGSGDGADNGSIAAVVTNFFNNPQPPTSRSCETIDLTSVGSNVISKIASWMSTIENFIRDARAPRADAQSQCIDESVIDITTPGPSVPKTIDPNINEPSGSQRVPKAIPFALDTPPKESSGRTLECPICMESLTNSIASTLCGHVFCMDCIKSSIKSNGKKCPTCRKPLKGAGYHQLFL